jgi:hypothetical protein
MFQEFSICSCSIFCILYLSMYTYAVLVFRPITVSSSVLVCSTALFHPLFHLAMPFSYKVYCKVSQCVPLFHLLHILSTWSSRVCSGAVFHTLSRTVTVSFTVCSSWYSRVCWWLITPNNYQTITVTYVFSQWRSWFGWWFNVPNILQPITVLCISSLHDVIEFAGFSFSHYHCTIFTFFTLISLF